MTNRRSVILVYPREVTGWQAQPWRDLPLGLLCVATPLVHSGYSVEIIDQRVDPHWQTSLEKGLKSDPLCVGISSTTGPQLKHAMEVSRIVKKKSHAPVVWGGVHASLLPEQTLKQPEIDFVVQGEGEETFLELVRALENNTPVREIAGLWYKENGKIIATLPRPFIDLNLQPPLAYQLVDVSHYSRTVFGVKRLSLSTSRGCAHSCAFCYNTAFDRRQFRAMNSEVALDRIKEFVSRYSLRGLFLTDANFFMDLNRAREILEGVVRANLGLIFTRLHIRFDTLIRLTDEDFRLIERAGCKCLSVGVEAGSERIRTLLRKPIDVPRLLELNQRLKPYSFLMLYFFMIGFPTESLEELKETVNLYNDLASENPRASKSVNIYTPFPGTELFELAVAEGFSPPQELEGWSSYNYRSPGGKGSWRSSKVKKLLEMLDFCSFFVGSNNFLTPFKKTNPFAVHLASLYAPIARRRVKYFFYHFPVEIKLAKKLGLYAKSG